MAKGTEVTRRRRDGSYETRETGFDEDLIAREKYDPSLRGNVQSQEAVEKSGGLGALARKLKGMPTSSSTPEPSPAPKKKAKGLIPSY